jgi:cytochrome P450
VSIRRKALKPFTFASGAPHVPLGQIACISAWDFMHDDSKYPNPYTFDGLRFVAYHEDSDRGAKDNDLRGTQLTDASKDFPIWGLGSKVW